MHITTAMLIPGDLFDGDTPAFEEYARAIIEENMPYLQNEADNEYDLISYVSASEWEARGEYRRWWRERLARMVAEIRRDWQMEQDNGPQQPSEEVIALRQEVAELTAQNAQKDKVIAQERTMRLALEEHAADLYRRLNSLENREETFEIPPPCKCGRISYRVYCVCGEQLQ